MCRIWNSVREQYGQNVTLRLPDGEISVRAFFQPVDEKAPGDCPTVLGIAPVGRYLYLGPSEQNLDDVEELEWDGRFFRILRHRGYWVGEKMVYRWAICEELDTAMAEVAG